MALKNNEPKQKLQPKPEINNIDNDLQRVIRNRQISDELQKEKDNTLSQSKQQEKEVSVGYKMKGNVNYKKVY